MVGQTFNSPAVYNSALAFISCLQSLSFPEVRDQGLLRTFLILSLRSSKMVVISLSFIVNQGFLYILSNDLSHPVCINNHFMNVEAEQFRD